MRAGILLTEAQRDAFGIIHPGSGKQETLNVYREVRSRLLRLSKRKNFVCLVSAIGQEGETSLLSLNLATVFALDALRSAIVIDCDPGANILDELTADLGEHALIDFIEQEVDDPALLLKESGIERVRIVPSGRMTYTRTEALESSRMREVVQHLKERFADRYIFVNGPCSDMSSDLQTLASISDMVLFEVAARTVLPSDVSQAIELIGPDKVAGILFRER